jgi:[protein-PII] uridylyltransferase
VLNGWKIEVLSVLFQRAMQHLSGDAHGASAVRRRDLHAEVLQALDADSGEPWFQEQVAALPTGYLFAHPPEFIAADLRDLRRLGAGEARARGRYVSETHAVEYAAAAGEEVASGAFHKLAGALTAAGMQILSAEINTLVKGLVLDRFFVHDPDFPGEPPPQRMEEVSRALERSLLSDAAPSFRRLWQKSGGRGAAEAIALPTQVRIDNSTSESCTIIDIFTADRMGLLYAIGRALYELGLSVSVAKIGTYLDQVVDVFYVTDRSGRKIEQQERLEEIRARLLETIAAMDRM